VRLRKLPGPQRCCLRATFSQNRYESSQRCAAREEETHKVAVVEYAKRKAADETGVGAEYHMRPEGRAPSDVELRAGQVGVIWHTTAKRSDTIKSCRPVYWHCGSTRRRGSSSPDPCLSSMHVLAVPLVDDLPVEPPRA
jgi:hypothetical protein